MADETEERTPKTKTLGYLPLEKAKSLKGWASYEDKAAKFSEAKTAAETAKEAIRSALKSKLKMNGDIDFTLERDRIKIFENFEKKGRRTKTTDLSDRF